MPLPGNYGEDDSKVGETHAQTRVFEEAKQFITENKDRTFFCYCPWTPPHGFWQIPPDEPAWQNYKDKTWDSDDAKVYAAMVEWIDRQVGDLLAMLKEYGIDDNTIVIVSGDNGGQKYFDNFFGPNKNPITGVEFRGDKGDLYEGGLRVPYIVRWPGKIKPNTVTDHLCHFSDVMPTLAELAGVKPAENIDGISFVPTLLGESAAGRSQEQHEYLYWEYLGKLAVRMGNWKAVRLTSDNTNWQLYDLSTDISESTDVSTASEENESILALMISYSDQAHVDQEF